MVTTPSTPNLGRRPPVSTAVGIGVVLAAAAVVTLLGWWVSRPGTPGIDLAVWQFFVDLRRPWLTPIVITWTWVGSTIGMTVWCVTLAALLWRRGDRPNARLVLAVGIGAALLVTGLKRLVGRSRPPEEFRLVTELTDSFPSGHSLASAAILGVTIVLVPVLVRRSAVLLVRVGLIVFWLGIGLSRLYLGVHWATDVVAGWVTGAAWVVVALMISSVSSRPSDTAAPADRRRRTDGPDEQLRSRPDGQDSGRP